MSDFQVDLESLNKVARDHMRDLSYTYGVLANEVRNTSLADGNVAADPPICGDGGAFANAYTDLRNEIVKMLDNCAGNAVKIGKALEHVVDTYAATDAQIEEALKRQSDTLNHTA